MDVEQTKKMNFMIKELTKSGMVTSFEDAIDKASSMYENAMPEERQQEAKAPCSHVQAQSVPQSNSEHVSQSVDLLERKFTNTLKQNNQAIATEMRKIWEELKALKDMSKPAQAAHPAPAGPQPAAPQKAESHPRQGDFNPTNVDLEKYFYYGNR
ncbi:MAG: hypothetical protein ACQESG_00875 [Nanobdellota archaeon]